MWCRSPSCTPCSTSEMTKRRRSSRSNEFLVQVHVRFSFRGHNTFGQLTAVVVDETVLPLEKVGDGLRLDANLDPAQAGQKQVHFPHEAGGTALAVAGGPHHQAHLAPFALEQPPFCREFAGADQSRGRKVKALTAHAQAGVFAKRLFPIGEEIGPGDLALDQDRAALPFPADYVRSFSTGTGLFREHDPAAIFPPQPLLRKTDKLLVGHDLFFIVKPSLLKSNFIAST